MTRWRPAEQQREDGSILLLALGCLSIALILVVVVVDASAVFLARRSLASAADSASLAGAQSVSGQAIYANGAGAQLPLDAVQAAVARYESDGHPGELNATVDHEATGDTVVVTGRRSVQLPFASFLGISDVVVTATSSASSVRLQPAP